ncbi:hypothetical protein DLJ58_14890 [Micromonospora arida]|uniref:Uncharacterized protein n=1 Tax=Micromonospora arida TaxID=2203715 RepID=A0A3N9X9D0_9ACTN|nr:hypothetical protein DLJ58_14890 [Micromonospora arida]
MNPGTIATSQSASSAASADGSMSSRRIRAKASAAPANIPYMALRRATSCRAAKPASSPTFGEEVG